VFAGIEERTWIFVSATAQILAYVTGALTLRLLLADTNYTAFHGYSRYIEYAILLTWLGGWTILSSVQARGWKLIPPGLLYAVMLWNALYSQSRSWLINTILIALVFAARCTRTISARGRIVAVALPLVLVAVTAAAVWTLRAESAGLAIENFTARTADDTRSAQYVDFFADVAPSELLIGRGPKGTWYWPEVGDYRYFDNGYLWILFIGGVPMLVSYFVIVVIPGLRAIRLKRNGPAATAATLVLVWALALTGLSTYTLPSLTTTHLFVALLVGRCYAILETGIETQCRRPVGMNGASA
jgi:hypothetical protein